jgi:iron-sulfur cluster assembly accessory protein
MLDTQETKTESSAPAADSSSTVVADDGGVLVGLTAKAAEKVMEIRAAEGIEESMGLRLRVVGGGCSGFSYDLYFDNVADADKTLESHGVKLVVDQMSLMYLVGTEVDYVEGLQGAGFKFQNPNVKSTCGCGSSFSA